MPSIIYDHRENRSGVPGFLALEGVTVQAQQLPVGDYLLSERLVVERKTGADLVGSIKNRRLFDQVSRLRETYPAIVLVVEGTPEFFPEASWKGALASILATGQVSVLVTEDPQETAEWLARLARREERGPSVARGGARKPADPDRLAEAILSGLPGVSTKGAQRLLNHFGSLVAVFAADADALKAVEGFGAKRATQLAELFARAYDDSPYK